MRSYGLCHWDYASILPDPRLLTPGTTFPGTGLDLFSVKQELLTQKWGVNVRFRPQPVQWACCFPVRDPDNADF